MKHQLHVLMVEDSEDDALLLTRQLQGGDFELQSERVETASSFVSALESKEWDIILCDYKMPKFDGMKALTIVKERGIDVPFIFVSGTIGEDRAVEAMKAGAHDYVMKGNLKRLIPAIERELREAKVRKERKRAAEELKKSEGKFQAIFDNASDGMFLVDLNTRKFFICNAMCAKMLGYTQEEFLALDIADIHPKDELPFIGEHIGKFRRGEEGIRSDIRFKRRDGSIILADLSPAPITIAEKEYLLVNFKDVSERKRAEEELKRSEEKYRGIFENVQDVYYETSLEGKILEVSPSIALLSGGQYQRDDLLGKLMPDLYPDPGERQAFLVALHARGRVTDFEMSLKNRDCSQVPCSISAMIHFDSEGRPEKIIGSLRNISERKRAEESHLLLTTALESTANGVAITDLKGNMVWVNKAFIKMTGYTWTELLGDNPRILKSGKQDSSFYKHLWETISAGNVWTGELINKKKDGSLYTDEMTITPLKNENGEITNFIAIKQDITERNRAAAELKRRKEFFEAIMESSMDVILTVTNEGKLAFSNSRITSVLGYTFEEIEGRHFIEFIPEKYRAELLERWAKLLQGTGGTYELQIIKKDGTLADSLISYSPVQGFDENLVLVKDITVRKTAEKQNRMLGQAIKGISECISITDLDDKILFVNEAFLKTYGYEERELLGKNVGIVRSEKNRAEIAGDILAATIQGSWQGELLNRRKDGSEFRVSLSTSMLANEEGKAIALIGVATDITEHKRAEGTKRSLEAQLQQAQKLESIGTLASGIAHDFNNILGIILGYSTLLERLREDPQKHSESVAAITKATQRGASLVKQLLVFARKTEALFEIMSINDIIAEITKLLKDTFPKTITVSISLQQDLPSVVADASQIHQVLLNLCVNARDAMPKSGTLSISTRTIDGEAVSSRFAKATGNPVARQYVQIEVTDTGIGMDESTRQRIFEPFFTTKPPGKGTGLGLAVVYGIIEHHTGFIDVRSAPGEGTSFSVYLPIPERALKEVQQAKKSLEEIPGGTETILIIEDEEMLRELVKASLVSKGYTVLIAEDGIQGVEMYQRHQKEIAVVLSDIGLPLLSGQDVFNRIREINPRAKVILASGFFDPETKSQMYRAGLKNFIQKPYMQDKVLQKIREAIDTNG